MQNACYVHNVIYLMQVYLHNSSRCSREGKETARGIECILQHAGNTSSNLCLMVM
jgi:hypothetical protein